MLRCNMHIVAVVIATIDIQRYAGESDESA